MADMRRSRGRLPGDWITEDKATLNGVADLMLNNPELKPTAAIKVVLVDRWEDKDLRRLRSKWKCRRDKLLADARVRSATEQAHRRASQGTSMWDSPTQIALRRVARGLSDCSTLLDISGFDSVFASLERYKQAMDSPVLRAAQEESERIMRLVNETPSMRAMREIEHSPAAQILREMENSPAMQTMRDLSHQISLNGCHPKTGRY